jgi:hypothetical protein
VKAPSFAATMVASGCALTDTPRLSRTTPSRRVKAREDSADDHMLCFSPKNRLARMTA